MGTRIDYHVHLEKGPYEESWLQAFLETAERQGLQEIGFSEHLHDFFEGQAVYGPWWEADPDPVDREHAGTWWQGRPRYHLEQYVAFIRRARSRGITLRLAVEADYIPGCEGPLGHLLTAYPFDYVLGSVHWLGAWGFDHLDRLHRWEGRDVDAAYRLYFDLLSRAARSGVFDVMAHADLIKVAGHRPSFDLAPLYEAAARAFSEAGVAVEVSTAGLRRPVGEVYPAEPFLRLCRAQDVSITLASDAHEPGDVGRDLERAVVLARRCGYAHLCRFSRRERELVPL